MSLVFFIKQDRSGVIMRAEQKLLFSIVIPTYNAMSENENLMRLLDSIFKQTFKNFEVIVVDNYSIDRTVEVCEQFPVKFIQTKCAISDARNIGIDLAKGQYVFNLDADMEIPSRLLEECARTVTSYKVDCILIDNKYVSDDPTPFVDCAYLRELECRLGATDIPLFVFSKSFIGTHRYPTNVNLGEDFPFRNYLMAKHPRTRKINSRIIHYFDPKLSSLAKRSWRYGKELKATRKRIGNRQSLDFFRNISIFKLAVFLQITKLQANSLKALFMPIYFLVKYLAFILGVIATDNIQSNAHIPCADNDESVK